MKSNFNRKSLIQSEDLDKRLSNVLHAIHNEETRFRANFVNKWTIMFCDISRKISEMPHTDDDLLKTLIIEYRDFVLAIVQEFEPVYTSPGDGPQLVLCFEKAEEAADAAIAIQKGLEEWKDRSDGAENFIPSIGLHSGEFVFKDDELKQSNACNLGKRIETQADHGKIFVSSTTKEALNGNPKFIIQFVKKAMLKNIPEVQDIFSLEGQASVNVAKVSRPAGISFSSLLNNQEIECNMGLLICDVSGSTKKFWILGDREGNLLIETFQKEVFLILKKYKATHIEQREGDMIIACFMEGKPVLNVMAAIEIQKTFFRRNTNLATRTRHKIETSIGIHYGNMIIRNQKIIPTPDFLTCKGIQDMAQANEVWLSAEMYKHIKEYTHFPVMNLGETPIKGFADPIPLFSLEWHRTTG